MRTASPREKVWRTVCPDPGIRGLSRTVGGFASDSATARSAAWKPILEWVPSQNGLVVDPPHRHRAMVSPCSPVVFLAVRVDHPDRPGDLVGTVVPRLDLDLSHLRSLARRSGEGYGESPSPPDCRRSTRPEPLLEQERRSESSSRDRRVRPRGGAVTRESRCRPTAHRKTSCPCTVCRSGSRTRQGRTGDRRSPDDGDPGRGGAVPHLGHRSRSASSRRANHADARSQLVLGVPIAVGKRPDSKCGSMLSPSSPVRSTPARSRIVGAMSIERAIPLTTPGGRPGITHICMFP